MQVFFSLVSYYAHVRNATYSKHYASIICQALAISYPDNDPYSYPNNVTYFVPRYIARELISYPNNASYFDSDTQITLIILTFKYIFYNYFLSCIIYNYYNYVATYFIYNYNYIWLRIYIIV